MNNMADDAQDSSAVWNEFQFNSAKNFISNVVFIDDRPWVEQNIAHVDIPEFLEKDDSEDAAMGGAEEVDAIEITEGVETVDPPVDEHHLKVKELIASFADQEISASFLFPSSDDDETDVIKQAHKLSKIADIVVIDWFLKNSSPELTAKILQDLVSAYQNGEWRTRLVCIYTGEEVAVLPDTLNARLAKVFDAEPCVKNEDSSLTLGDDVRIIFLNKKEVLPSGLPQRLIEEFAKITDGLLPTFAINSVAALRRNTHSLLSAFSKDLDPAIVGHRMYLSDSDDAELFGLDVLMMQLRSILSTNTVHRESLSQERFENWISLNCPKPREIDGASLALSEFVGLMGECYSTTLDKQPKGKKRKKWVKAARHAAYRDEQHLSEVTVRMGRLSKLIREYKGVMPLPEKWRPTLGLGSILKSDSGNGVEYWLCVQPLCDSVRMEESRFFPLLKLNPKAASESENEDVDKYWLVVKDEDAGAVLSLRANPKDGDFIKFAPDSVTRRVLAAKQDDGSFVFKSCSEHEVEKHFQWIADVEPLQAQRAVAEMTAQLNRVGVDEYEALRRGMPF